MLILTIKWMSGPSSGQIPTQAPFKTHFFTVILQMSAAIARVRFPMGCKLVTVKSWRKKEKRKMPPVKNS